MRISRSLVPRLACHTSEMLPSGDPDRRHSLASFQARVLKLGDLTPVSARAGTKGSRVP